MMKIAVVLSGCGASDGSEIHEAVLALLALNRARVPYECLAPNIPQAQVVDPITGNRLSGEKRNVLQEAARIARGHIQALDQANPENYSAAVFPGGYGAALNLCDFGKQGKNFTLEPSVLSFTQSLITAGKPIGFICIAPVIAAKLYGSGVQITVGSSDSPVARELKSLGANLMECPATECVVDLSRKVVTTPAYMSAKSISEVAIGIEKLVQRLLELI